MKKIFVRNSGFGDTIWTEPIVRYFLSKGESVSIFTKHKCVFDNYPNNQLFVNKMEKLPPLYEESISLRMEEYPQMNYLKCYQKQARIPQMKLTPPRIYLSEVEKIKVIPEPYVILHLDFYT